MLQYTPNFSRIHPPWLHQLQALYLLLMHKNSMCKTVVSTHTNFLPLACLSWLTLFPKLILLNPHVSNNFEIWPLTPTILHAFNDWLWEHTFKNWKVHIQITNLGKWVELIYIGNSPLDPLLAIILDPPLSCRLIHPPSLFHVPLTIGITFYY